MNRLEHDVANEGASDAGGWMECPICGNDHSFEELVLDMSSASWTGRACPRMLFIAVEPPAAPPTVRAGSSRVSLGFRGSPPLIRLLRQDSERLAGRNGFSTPRKGFGIPDDGFSLRQKGLITRQHGEGRRQKGGNSREKGENSGDYGAITPETRDPAPQTS